LPSYGGLVPVTLTGKVSTDVDVVGVEGAGSRPHFYWEIMNALEIVALDFFFANLPYVQELAALGPDAVTLRTSGGETVDVSGLAAIVAQDWTQFESQIQAHFGFDPSLNDQLQLAGVSTLTMSGLTFAVGGWF